MICLPNYTFKKKYEFTQNIVPSMIKIFRIIFGGLFIRKVVSIRELRVLVYT